MPAEFTKWGISFQYPENWRLDEEDALAGHRSVTVYTPGEGFWSISLHPPDTEPQSLAKEVAEAMREEYEGMETEETRETISGFELVGYDFNFFFLDLTVTATVRCIRGDDATYAVLYQAEDREFARVEAVFQAMTTSFLRTLRGLRHGQ